MDLNLVILYPHFIAAIPKSPPSTDQGVQLLIIEFNIMLSIINQTGYIV